jgi:hypothetical protein
MVTEKTKIKQILRAKYENLLPYLNEKTRRLWAATEAKALGRGGLTLVFQATGLRINTIKAGINDLLTKDIPSERIRRPGGGRKKLTEKDKTLIDKLNALVEPTTFGSPESPLRWTCKSTPKLAQELVDQGYQIGRTTVGNILKQQNYSLQSNRKTKEGSSHPDRNAQFNYINESVKKFQNENQPVISVDAKKKELVGNFKNNGQEWKKKGNPLKVNMHDFIDKKLGKVIPYGVYDLSKNEGWVSIGIDHDTAAFAVESIRRWWTQMGRQRYTQAKKLLITADCGGSNGNQNKLWKQELQKLADEFNLGIYIRHFPPGTSKWNKIEHKMFCFISQNWRGRPLLSRATIINLISNARTKKGLTIQAEIDKNNYAIGKKVTDKELKLLNLHQESFHGEWNYKILPKNKKSS